MQEALAYFIVFCAAIIGVRRYAPRLARRVQTWLQDMAVRLSGGQPPARTAESASATVQRISPDALKRTLPKGKGKAKP